MASWIPRNSLVLPGTQPYDWSSSSLFECTWYAYWRVQEGSGLTEPPCWYSGSGSTGYGYYTNAKEWLDHYRDPWEVYDISTYPSYKCTPGDIIVFTGNYGHVVVVEKVNADGTLCISDYNLMGGEHAFGYMNNYHYGDIIIGYMTTGACIGVLHNPNITPVDRLPITAMYKSKRRKRQRRYNNYVKI